MVEELKTYDDVRKKIESNRELVNTEIHLLSPPVQEAVNSTFDICLFLVNKVEELDNKINKNSSNSSNLLPLTQRSALKAIEVKQERKQVVNQDVKERHFVRSKIPMKLSSTCQKENALVG
jgi:hypothetical protein